MLLSLHGGLLVAVLGLTLWNVFYLDWLTPSFWLVQGLVVLSVYWRHWLLRLLFLAAAVLLLPYLSQEDEVLGSLQGLHLRVLPLGDSITAGVGSSDGAGYRRPLFTALQGQAAHVDFIGTQRHGHFAENLHAGHPGIQISETLLSSPAILAQRPNVILLQIGTNDIMYDIDPKHATQRLEAMLDEIELACPDVVILLGLLCPSANAAWHRKFRRFNRRLLHSIHNRVRRNRANADVSRLVVVDIAHHFDRKTDLDDLIHPNDSGYQHIAEQWLHGLRQAAGKNLIQPPEDLTVPMLPPVKAPPCTVASTWGSMERVAAGMTRGDNIRVLLGDVNRDGRADYLFMTETDLQPFINLGRTANSTNTSDPIEWKPLPVIPLPEGLVAPAAPQPAFLSFEPGTPLMLLFPQPDSSVVGYELEPSENPYVEPFRLLPRGTVIPALATDLRGGSGGWGIRLADVDGDGRLDYVHISVNGRITVWLNEAKKPGLVLDTPSQAHLTSSNSAADRVWRSLGQIFMLPDSLQGSRPGARMHIADITADGRADVLLTHDDGSVQAWLNNGAIAVAKTWSEPETDDSSSSVVHPSELDQMSADAGAGSSRTSWPGPRQLQRQASLDPADIEDARAWHPIDRSGASASSSEGRDTGGPEGSIPAQDTGTSNSTASFTSESSRSLLDPAVTSPKPTPIPNWDWTEQGHIVGDVPHSLRIPREQSPPSSLAAPNHNGEFDASLVHELMDSTRSQDPQDRSESLAGADTAGDRVDRTLATRVRFADLDGDGRPEYLVVTEFEHDGRRGEAWARYWHCGLDEKAG